MATAQNVRIYDAEASSALPGFAGGGEDVICSTPGRAPLI
jgi:hypothetical protein